MAEGVIETVILLLMTGILFGQGGQASGSAPTDISKWDLICFCITSVNTPHFAVRADTNGQVLYYAQNGATKAQLQQAIGAPLAESQLALLRDWRLLKLNGDVYTTSPASWS